MCGKEMRGATARTLALLVVMLLLPLSAATLSLRLIPPHPYVGEAILGVLTLRSDGGKPLGGVRIEDPAGREDLAIERLDANRSLEHPDDATQRRFYRIVPLRSGQLRLPEIRAAIQRFAPGSNALVWQPLSLPPRLLAVRPLPPGIPLAGDLRLRLHLDKRKLKADEPLHLRLEVFGEGNLELLPPLNFQIEGVAFYADKPVISREFNASDYRERWSRSFVLSARRSFTLPPIRLRLLNRTTGLVETLSTPTTPIAVTPPPLPPKRWLLPLAALLTGLLLGALGLWAFLRRGGRTSRTDTPLIRRIKAAKGNRELYAALLPHSSDPALNPFLEALEANLYRGEKIKIDKKALIETLEQIVEG